MKLAIRLSYHTPGHLQRCDDGLGVRTAEALTG